MQTSERKNGADIRKMAAPKLLKTDKIHSTRNYDLFKTIKGNRAINENWVLELAEKIQAKDLRVPIDVTPKMEIIDGQHRLEARRILDLDVPYIIINATSIADVQALNNDRKKWSNTDWLESYIERGNQHYVKLKWFRQTYKLPLNISAGLLMNGLEAGALSTNEIFRKGQFEVRRLGVAKDVAEKLASLDGIFLKWKSHSFAATMIRLMQLPVFDWDRFMQKVKARPAMLKGATIEEYIDAIEKLYNWHVQPADRTSLRYAK